MGIPTYFAHILKNYDVTSYIESKTHNIHYLYLDSNSFIYDAIHNKCTTEKNIFNYVCDTIYRLIQLLQPEHTFIAFDGVVPYAKMKQQRERRFKSTLLESLEGKELAFDTCCITTGTTFMKNLNKHVKKYIQSIQQHNITFSGSDIQGEGEHKIYQHLKTNTKLQHTIYIYGLDADLIILSLEHLQYCRNIFLVRENFENEIIKLNIEKLQTYIHKELNPSLDIQQSIISQDYITLSFMLGNDFLPHSPVLNIRTHGIKNIIHCYKEALYHLKGQYSLTTNSLINWDVFRVFCDILSKHEYSYLKHEVDYRKKEKYTNEK